MKLSAIALSATTTAVIGSTAAFEQEVEERDRHYEYTVLFWEREAQSHYRMRAWEEVIPACTKVLDVPGQSETNGDVLFKLGYAFMRLGDYDGAADNFVRSHRIDGRRIALRLAMLDLRRLMRSPTRGPNRRRSRGLRRAAASCHED